MKTKNAFFFLYASSAVKCCFHLRKLTKGGYKFLAKQSKFHLINRLLLFCRPCVLAFCSSTVCQKGDIIMMGRALPSRRGSFLLYPRLLLSTRVLIRLWLLSVLLALERFVLLSRILESPPPPPILQILRLVN